MDENNENERNNTPCPHDSEIYDYSMYENLFFLILTLVCTLIILLCILQIAIILDKISRFNIN